MYAYVLIFVSYSTRNKPIIFVIIASWKITERPEGVDIVPCPPPKYATDIGLYKYIWSTDLSISDFDCANAFK